MENFNRLQLLDPDKMSKFVDDYARDNPEAFSQFTKQMEENFQNSVNREADIISLPKEDTIWLIVEQEAEIVDGELKRTLIMVDKKQAYLGVHMENPKQMSISDQAYALLCLCCLYPLSGKSRRPKLITFKDPNLARNISLNVSKLGIRYITPNSIKEAELEDEELVFMRICCVCRTSGTQDLFKKCAACQGVMYCSKTCQKKDWKKTDTSAKFSHKIWCNKLKSYMDMTEELAKFPFIFTSETTAADFHPHKFKMFLKKCGVYNQGLWRRECPVDLLRSGPVPFGTLNSDDNPYILPVESSILQSKPNRSAPDLLEAFQDWKAYYSWRNLNMDSPIAILLHIPLTLYYIITSIYTKDYADQMIDIMSKGTLNLHLLGVEKEVEMLMIFQELGYLLPNINIDIKMFGNEINDDINGKRESYNNINITIYKQVYHLYKGDKPDIAIGLNSGIGAYPIWSPTIYKLNKEKTAAYFTDYCQYSCECARLSAKDISVTFVPSIVNPFRNPVRKPCLENNMPWYSNGFIMKLENGSND